MASSPFTPRLTPTTPRIVSVNMDYPADHTVGDSNHENDQVAGDHPELNMDIMHDFGEGVGVDMRDFPSHSEGDGDETVGLAEALGDGLHKSELMTPTMPTTMTPQPPTSVSTNGHSSIHGMEAPSSSGVELDDMFKTETGLDGDDDDDEGDDTETTPHGKRARHNDVPGGFTFVDKDGESGRRKIRIEYIADKSRRHITFSKRKAGIMKKAYELSILTGTQVLLLVVSETGLVYTFTTTKLQPLVQKAEGKNLIQACLSAPEGYGPDGQPLGGPVPATKAKNGGLAIRPHKLTPSASAALAASAQAASMAQAASEDHSQAQADATAGVGQGTPGSARPKKRLPSGKGKKAAAAAAAEIGSGDMIPPVPQLPDMHRQASPHGTTPNMIQQTLASPLSAGYHIPPEYAHHQASPTTASFGYTGPPPPGQEYGQQAGYYAPPPQPGQGYLNVQQQQQAHMQYQAEQRERARMMMDTQGRTMGMGM